MENLSEYEMNFANAFVNGRLNEIKKSIDYLVHFHGIVSSDHTQSILVKFSCSLQCLIIVMVL